MNNQFETTPIAIQIRKLLSEHIGIEPEDMTDDDTIMHDLHMKPSEFSDFLEGLNDQGIDTSHLDLSSIKTVGELIEGLSSHEYTE